jgi:hypothetical protein
MECTFLSEIVVEMGYQRNGRLRIRRAEGFGSSGQLGVMPDETKPRPGS